MYCSMECANPDRQRHEVDCLASRERRTLFAAAKTMQGVYYSTCEMDFKFAVENGYRVGTKEHYDPGVLQLRRDAVRLDKLSLESFLASFGGYRLILQELEEFTSPLRGERMTIVPIGGSHYEAINLIVFESTDMLIGLNVRVCRVNLRMKRTRSLSFEALLSRTLDQHKVFKITTGNSESYALDIAGAQFGLHTAVVSWQRYVDRYLRDIQSSEDISIA